MAFSCSLAGNELHEMTGSWHTPLLMTAGVCIVWALLALFAGRSHVIVRTKSGKDIIIDDTGQQVKSHPHTDVHAEIAQLKAELHRITKERDQLKNTLENKQ